MRQKNQRHDFSLRHRQLVVIPGAGHFVPFETPKPFLEALTSFLDETEPADTSEDRFRALLVGGADPDQASEYQALRTAPTGSSSTRTSSSKTNVGRRSAS